LTSSIKNTIKKKINKFYRFFKKQKPISGINNIINNSGQIKNVTYKIHGNNNVIEVKKGALLSDIMIYIKGDNHKFVVNEYAKIKGGSVWFEDMNCIIAIGKSTTIESAHLAATEPNSKIIIGEDCMLSTDVEFRTGDSHSIIDAATNKRINYAKNIQVKNHVWIGARATVLKGVTIDENSIVSTGAIVTKNVAANSIVAGIPAKIIKTGVTWKRERIYEQ
jgi:acetyltransferase-like isoleucine patch superfamily enzyme